MVRCAPVLPMRSKPVARFAESLAVFLFLIIYFFSGFAALLYQVIWQRMLAFFSGADLYSITTIVASFMAGLGLGSLSGGVLADKVSPRWRIGLFALAEFLTGIAGLLSKWWYYDILYTRLNHLASSPFLLTIVLFSSLLVPTFFMGTSLPLLAKALTPTIEVAGRRIGLLYAVNTLGAACGSFATAWVLMGGMSFERILQIGALINLWAAVLALGIGALLWKKLNELPLETAEPEDVVSPAAEPAFSFTTWVLVYGLSGFVALSLEIVWFRLLGVMLKSNSFTFPHLLGIYLASLAVGTICGVRWVEWARRPERMFLGLQSGITIYSALSIALLRWALDHLTIFGWLRAYLAGYEPFDVNPLRRAIDAWISGSGSVLPAITGPQPNFLSLYMLLPIVLIAPPTFLMGASFPFLQRVVQDSRTWLGRRVGWLQASNIFGATLGAIFVGALFLTLQGTTGTLRLLIALGGIFLILWTNLRFRATPSGTRAGRVVALAIAGAAIWSVPSRTVLWGKLHGSTFEEIISAEDGSGLSVLKTERPDFSATTVVYINGLGQSWIPFTHLSGIHSQLGIIPIMLHHEPRDIAVIGLGSGDTLYSLGGREETQAITCIEIVRPQLETLKLLHQKRQYGGLDSMLTDARIRYVFADGRAYIGSNQKKYDVIEADALRPSSAFAGNLYSYEYFQLLKSRLKPGGFAVTWAPTRRVLETFLKVFPHAFNFDSVVVGSIEPIEFDREMIRARLEHPFTKAYYARAGVDAKRLVLPFLERPLEDLKLDPSGFALTDFNTDLFPKDEYGR